MQVVGVLKSTAMENAVRSARFHDGVTGATEDAKTPLASKNPHCHIGGVTLLGQAGTAAVDVIELESVCLVDLVPAATGAVGFAT